ncbi:MAG: methyltransferase domain-containing protein [Pseudomonadota bacterium]
MRALFFGFCGAAVLSACAFDTGGGTYNALGGQRIAPPPTDYVALVGHPDRPVDDFADDAARKPAQVLEFTGVGYGMTVIDVEAGWGYYTELFARAVGDTGRVYLQNPENFYGFVDEAIEDRLADNRLPGVEVMISPFHEYPVPDGSVDIVAWMLGPHELWFTPEGEEEGVLGDPERAFFEIARVLKPDGVFIALDHVAPEGSPETTGNTIHRIDPDIILRRAEAAGLQLIESSDLHANPDDDYSISAIDPSVRRKTDRFLFKFGKR